MTTSINTETSRTPLFEGKILRRSLIDSFRKLNPRELLKNPVMFVVAVSAVLSTIAVIRKSANGDGIGFALQVVIWLWFTVLFANFAEAMAEGRGKAQAESLRKIRTQTTARRLVGDALNGREERVRATELRRGTLEILDSPYRQLIDPIRESVEQELENNPEGYVNVIMGHLVMDTPWEQALHQNSAMIFQLALQSLDRVVVTIVPYQVHHLDHAHETGAPANISSHSVWLQSLTLKIDETCDKLRELRLKLTKPT
jgi:hypothetical protein